MKRIYSAIVFFFFVYCLFAQNGRILIANHSCDNAGNVERVFHLPVYYSGNPVLKAIKNGN